MPKQAFGTEMSRWKQLAEGVLKEAEELPHLGPQAAQLADLVARLHELHALQWRLKGELGIAIRQLQDGRELARDLSSRLQAGLKQAYGVHSGHLRSFGARPRRKGRRGTAAEPESSEVPS